MSQKRKRKKVMSRIVKAIYFLINNGIGIQWFVCFLARIYISTRKLICYQ